MILVVADTSPLHYLILIRAIEILPRLFARVAIPPAVWGELTHPGAPRQVREWALSLPEWVEVRRPGSTHSPEILDAGESEAIALAGELDAAAILLDEQEAREEARRLGLTVTGTIGLLERAAHQGLLDLQDAFGRLLLTNFRISDDLVEQALKRQTRRQQKGK